MDELAKAECVVGGAVNVRKYLTFSWWLLNKGWADVMQRVEAAVRHVFRQASLRDQLSSETFSSKTGQVRSRRSKDFGM